jgi:hypothetical protein
LPPILQFSFLKEWQTLSLCSALPNMPLSLQGRSWNSCPEWMLEWPLGVTTDHFLQCLNSKFNKKEASRPGPLLSAETLWLPFSLLSSCNPALVN